MPDNSLTLEVNGRRYSGWKSVAVKRSLESMGGAFDISLTEKWPEQPVAWPIVAGDKCRILIGDDPVITGYVDKTSVQYDQQSHELKVSGRDTTGDLIDCSAPSTSFCNATLPEIARDLAEPFGIDVDDETADEGYSRIPRRSVQNGESVFRNLERQALTDGRLLVTDGNGKLVITRAGKGGNADDVLELGVNIKAASIERDFSQTYSDVTVKGQASAADLESFDLGVAGPSHTVTRDEPSVAGSVSRHRPLILVAETQADGQRCQQRAEWEQARRKGKETRISITVQGWRQSSGRLWTINQKVRLACPYLRADGWWLIAGVDFRLDESGSVTVLTLGDEAGFQPQGKVSKAAEAAKAFEVL